MVLRALRSPTQFHNTSPLLRAIRSQAQPKMSILRPFQRSYQYGGQSDFFENYRIGKAILWTTVGANVVVFAGWQLASQQVSMLKFLNNNFTFNSEAIMQRPWTLLTSAFSHQSLNHLAGNMFSLYAFSSVLLSCGLSPVVFSTVLLGSAVAGNLGSLYHESTKGRSWGRRTRSLGASGAVLGVGAAATLLAPTTSMLLLGLVPVPLWAILGGYIYYDSYNLDDPNSVIGHAAHLGGAAFGAASYVFYLRRFGGVLGRRW
jgi:membrane associated rhomboid family serine protease